MPKTRLDILMHERGLAESREKARAMILAGLVYVNGQRVDKAGHQLPDDAPIEVKGDACPYVSRGGLKLASALDRFGIDVAGMRCLDVGISTGGFTDCLLQRGAAHVIGVDVGYGQLAWSLRQDERVTLIERTNARTLTLDMIGGESVDLATIDASFISLTLILPAVAKCVRPGGIILPMVKPQFEVGKDRVGAGGVVRDEALRREAADSVKRFLEGELGLRVVDESDNPLTGPKGNREIFLSVQCPDD
ncbi:MAG: TlyA family RNA methyltransferase [Deltaproteobacteria bacterium]|nr:TlyA family RNA methyltransferase [Deltaproteobacteria bacterium]MCB9478347.1 TlyA family RNA methyltransferase [Deltaproteobacteria bacterium]